MNIRSLTNPVGVIESVKPGETRAVRTEVSSEDRDADGKRQEEEANKDPLTEDELKKALEYLENLSGLKANQLTIEIENSNEYRLILIKDRSGKTIRRMVEWELRSLLVTTDKKTGQIFDKAV